VEGASGRHRWEWLIPHAEMPAARNPAAGYAVTCNQSVVADDYPHVISQHFGSDHRARRVTARVQAVPEGAMDVAAMGAIHGERESLTARQVIAACGRVAARRPPAALTAGGRAALEALLDWDGDMQPELVAPTVFAAVVEALTPLTVPRLFGEALGAEIQGGGRGGPTHWSLLRTQLFAEAAAGSADGPVRALLGHEPEHGGIREDILLPASGWDALFAAALDGAAVLLEARLGAPTPGMAGWAWAANHRTAPEHPLSRLHPELAALLDPPSVGCGGGFDTPQACSFGKWLDWPWTVKSLMHPVS
jgi:acyl-homoserine lactone acylase PvdQ